MHAVYKAVSVEDIERIVAYCQIHTVQTGGPFEVYPGEEESKAMIIVNSNSCENHSHSLRPVGAFYCNFVAPGVLSIEEDDPEYDGVDSRKDHVNAIKQVIDVLLDKGYPGSQISFDKLSVLKE